MDSQTAGNPEADGKGDAHCLHPECSLTVHARGLCQKHLREARRMIAAKEATEKELIARNMLLPAFQGHRGMREWLQRSRAEAPELGKKPRATSRSV